MEIGPEATGVTFQRLGVADAGDLQVLFERCADFFELTDGVGPLPDCAQKELAPQAPGKTAKDTFCFGVARTGRLIGFVHLIRDFPKSGEWWLGLLVLDPAERRRRLGTEIHQALRNWVASNGGRVMWLGVLQQNVVADRFWRTIGYIERERQVWTSSSGLQSPIVLMSLPLI